VKRDPGKRRYRHHWERAIRALLHAAHGKQAAPALLEAARARYALYRFSQVESDRDAALRLAARARRAGARPAAAFAAAVRREAGDGDVRSAVRAPSHARRWYRAAPAEPAGAEEGEGVEAVLAEALTVDDVPRPEPQPFEARPASATATAIAEAARVTEVRSWSDEGYTRVAVSLSRPVSFERLDLPAGEGLPRRLALDLSPAVLEPGAAAPAQGQAPTSRVRAAQHDPDTVRLVVELAPGAAEPQVVALQDPPLLLVDAGAPPAEPERPAVAAGELGSRRPVRRVIVDAGHGGHDTGAIGPTRVREKDVTLSMARRLSARLGSLGYEVLLTRRDDRTLSLAERTAFANAHRGDLFVSLHANAHPRRDRRGVETYVLNLADDRYAARLAARENGALSDEAGEGREVRRILSDLDAQSSGEASRRLAQRVQREVVEGLRARGEVRDLGVKSALFYVLLGARMPAVLVETAFISNRTEERKLADPRFQEAVAQALARAVNGFARGEARVAAR
jgi:N-acetylmuramoyl-L-alanine amidase